MLTGRLKTGSGAGLRKEETVEERVTEGILKCGFFIVKDPTFPTEVLLERCIR